MTSVGELIDLLGGNTSVSRELGTIPSTVSEMKRRNSIPVVHWPRLIEVARIKEVAGIDAELLMRLHSRQVAASEAAA